ncbi:hypothetical protein AGRO_4809 [Agrobacterium sp. ATCC 31749]|nr:hypothetical protein AGRO_4809 [Agrobacterium sp. ATCC 31749]
MAVLFDQGLVKENIHRLACSAFSAFWVGGPYRCCHAASGIISGVAPERIALAKAPVRR